VQDAGKIMHEHVRENRPGPRYKFTKLRRYGELIMNQGENILQTRKFTEHPQYTENSKHHQVDNDQLNVAVVIPLKSVLEIVEHILSITK
jgi:hypothetical protein